MCSPLSQPAHILPPTQPQPQPQRRPRLYSPELSTWCPLHLVQHEVQLTWSSHSWTGNTESKETHQKKARTKLLYSRHRDRRRHRGYLYGESARCEQAIGCLIWSRCFPGSLDHNYTESQRGGQVMHFLGGCRWLCHSAGLLLLLLIAAVARPGKTYYLCCYN